MSFIPALGFLFRRMKWSVAYSLQDSTISILEFKVFFNPVFGNLR
jgi:hypothetical protein